MSIISKVSSRYLSSFRFNRASSRDTNFTLEVHIWLKYDGIGHSPWSPDNPWGYHGVFEILQENIYKAFYKFNINNKTYALEALPVTRPVTEYNANFEFKLHFKDAKNLLPIIDKISDIRIYLMGLVFKSLNHLYVGIKSLEVTRLSLIKKSRASRDMWEDDFYSAILAEFVIDRVINAGSKLDSKIEVLRDSIYWIKSNYSKYGKKAIERLLFGEMFRNPGLLGLSEKDLGILKDYIQYNV